MKTNDNKFNLSNLFVAAAFTIISLFLIGLLIIENGVFDNAIINTQYEILDYEVIEVEDPTSPIGVKNQYIISLGGIKNDDVCVSFYTKHQYSKVYIDGNLICSVSPSDEYNFTETVGSNWVMFEVNKEDSDKQIIVEIVPIYEEVSIGTIEFIKGTAYSVFYKVLFDSLPQVILGFVAIIVGLIFVIISLYRKVVGKECFTIFMWGLFSLFIGTWRLFDSKFISFVFYKKPLFIYYVIVTMLTISPIPFLYTLRAESDKLWKKIFNIICILISMISIGQVALLIFYHVDVRDNLHVYHYFLISCLFIVLISEIYHKIKKYKRTNLIHEYLPIICLISVLLDLAVYYYTNDTSNALFTIFSFIFYIIISGVLTLREYALKEKVLKDELKQSQITLSLSQIQPHFIYNTLSSIRYLCKSDPDLAQRSIDDFSSYLRTNMSSLQNSDLIPFEKEISFIETYVKLEKLRFGDKVNMIYDIQEKDFYIPSLTIQPLVENAIKHGITVKEEGGTVILRSCKVDDKIKISIIDDGVGFNFDEHIEDSKAHIGLMNVKTRIHYLLSAEMNIKSSKNGTTIEIIIDNSK